MRKVFLVCLALMVLSAVPCLAGSIEFSGRAGLYSPSVTGANMSLMYGIAAYYDLNENWSLRGAVDTTTYSVYGQQFTYTPISLDVIYTQRLGNNLYPYAGLGVSYNSTTSAGNTLTTTGAQAEAGIRLALGMFTAGVEFRYLFPDLSNLNLGGSSFNGYATGSVFHTLYI
ncbi:MAG: porin family protein [Candidatus Margulisbacteria bacterium]|nr:porin family protein [Candidatus Margulisiibacteriota bacterium]MBU1022498.1 porin family protein [Candidatus Margulisiibacteriota bacterium]MBU1728482.1 porin family protein [Candidatus Margulisiibacteriota bacterium]MBU1954629.1 porin family protein [Candidatus Margulisiibacteriota bacterium]